MRNWRVRSVGCCVVLVSDDAVLVEQARSIAAQLDGRWFADFDELCLLAGVLVAAELLVSPVDVVEFFRRPWRFSAEHEVWQRCGRPAEVRGVAGEVLVALLEAGGRGAPPLILAPEIALTSDGRR